MKEWFQPHTLVELSGFIVTGLGFAWKLADRLARLETKVDLLLEGRELLKVRK
jgi:hypothetical protein